MAKVIEGQDYSNRLTVVEIKSSNPADGSVEVVSEEYLNQFASDEIGPGKAITLHFSLALAESGEIIDTNFDKASVVFEVGDGNFLAGFESALLGLKVGSKVIMVPCELAFGTSNEDNIQKFPLYQFPADLVLEKGMMISFADAKNNEQAGMVCNYDSEYVEIDFNHPLAGREIEFKVEILEIRAITK